MSFYIYIIFVYYFNLGIFVLFFILRRFIRGYCEGCGKNEVGVG